MAGKITVSTINDSSGVLATQNGMTGIAKAWVYLSTPSSATIGASFNVSSVTRTGVGAYTVNFTTAMPSTNYTACAGDGGANGYYGVFSNINSLSTTSISYQCIGVSTIFANADPLTFAVAVFSS